MPWSTLPLFPLNAVLFPGGPLKLRIFEPRYLDMIGRCMRAQTGFGVALILEGTEAGGPARTVEIGTAARIVDFETLADGLLGITAHGGQRFRIDSLRQASDGLNVCEVEWLADEAAAAVSEDDAMLAELLRRAIEQIGSPYAELEAHYDDASWVGMRLAEILPLPSFERQELLEMSDACERLQWLRARLNFIETD